MSFLPFFSLETWILLITFLGLFVMYGTWTYGVFEKLGIPCGKPTLYWGTVGQHNKVYYMDDVVCAQKYGKVWGMYELRRPMLAVVDPDLIKTILIKECFTYFTNRRNFGLNGELYDSVSIAEDDQWRRIRSILTPSFTSGRIKEMFLLMKHHSSRLTESLKAKAEREEVVCIKDFFGAYSLDVMASCALSVDLDTFKDPSGPFVTHASKLLRFPLPLFLLQGFFPFLRPLLSILGFSLFNNSAVAYFKTVAEKIKSQRSYDISARNSSDVFQYMLNTQKSNESNKDGQRKGGYTGLTDHEIVSQATMFVFGGYETSASALCFIAYCLARNPKCMTSLQEEIDATFPNKGPVTFEGLMQMDYLDSVVNEALRLYPPIPRLERMAKETVIINGTTIPKDMAVLVPVYALHRDPHLWPEPEEFQPDRFSKENKQHINPYTFLPFGLGPRNCLGMRFAMVGVKLALVEVLQTSSFAVCQETEIPLEMDPAGLLAPLRPMKLKIVKRCMEAENLDTFD